MIESCGFCLLGVFFCFFLNPEAFVYRVNEVLICLFAGYVFSGKYLILVVRDLTSFFVAPFAAKIY